MRAPKKVPAERIETMSEVVEVEMASAPRPAMASMNSLEERTPLMYPESYPKKIPPKEAKAHLRKQEKQGQPTRPRSFVFPSSIDNERERRLELTSSRP